MPALVRLFLPIFVCALSAAAHAEISLYAAPGSSSALVAEIQRTIDGFNAIVQEEFGTILSDEIRVRICPDKDCYIEDLRQELKFDLEQARLYANNSGGVAAYQKRLILVRLIDLADLPTHRNMIAHELTHMLQVQLAGHSSVMNKANRWINEGMADWMGALVASRVTGGTGMSQERLSLWRFEQLNLLRVTSQPLSAKEMDDADIKRWIAWVQDKRQPYTTADLMMLALAEQQKTKIFPALAGYLKCVSGFSFESTCFRANFGIAQDQFYANYQAWQKQALSKNGQLEIIAEEADDEARQVVLKAYHDSLAQLKTRFGKDLPIALRVYLHPDRDAMTLAIAQTQGINPTEAAKLTSKGVYRPSLALHLNLARFNSDQSLSDITKNSIAEYYTSIVGVPDQNWAAQ